MKKGILWWGLSLFCCGTFGAFAQSPVAQTTGSGAVNSPISNPSTTVTKTETERADYDQTARIGPHHRVHITQRQVQQEDGHIVTVTNQFIELATGLNYWEDGQWKETQELIETVAGGAVARHGPHKVIFNNNINSAGAIDMETATGERLRSHVLGLSYYDAATGDSVMIAEVTDTVGQILPPNVLIYPHCFDSVDATLRYTYTKHGLEQDVIIHEQLPSPADFGFSKETTRLEVITEFIERPPVRKTAKVIRLETDAQKRQDMVEPDFIDEVLDFDGVSLGRGKAFDLENGDAPSGSGINEAAVPVGKRFEVIDGRSILFEAVELWQVATNLNKLPERKDAAQVSPKKKERKFAGAALKRDLPKAKVTGSQTGEIKVAQLKSTLTAGFVLDYDTISGSLSNVTFRGNTTYYVSGYTALYGTTTLEGGTVIKFRETSYNAYFVIQGPFVCSTSPFCPAILTAKDDDKNGEPLTGISTGTVSGYYGGGLWVLLEYTGDFTAQNLRCNYLEKGVYLYDYYGVSGVKPVVANSQFKDCDLAIAHSGPITSTVLNCLFKGCYADVYSARYLICNNVTFDGGIISVGNIFYYTNCLFSSAWFPYTTCYSAYNATNDTPANVFESVGGGEHYLQANSPYRNVGTTNVYSALLADLRRKTTYPPVLLGTNIVVDTVLAPFVQRDTDIPDLGYHYDPIDYCVSQASIQNAQVTLTNGVTVATYGSIGLYLQGGAKLISQGTADRLNTLCRYETVQETILPAWDTAGTKYLFWPTANVSPTAQARFNFTQFTCIPPLHNVFANATQGSFAFMDCQFNSMWFSQISQGAYGTLYFDANNCLFDRCAFAGSGCTVNFYNNSFHGGTFNFLGGASASWVVKDNLFDACGVTNTTSTGITHDYNGYVSGYGRLTNNATHDVILGSSPAYKTSYLGNYYITSLGTLANAGSRTAASAGLYHHTMIPEQIKEGSSTVDIGFHYVAVAAGTENDVVWVEDALPTGATGYADSETWNWVSSSPSPVSGSLSHQSDIYTYSHQHYFTGATTTISLSSTDMLLCYTYIDPANIPGELEFQWYCTDGTGWNHRAYWGTDLGGSRTYMGLMPPAGGWVRLEVPASSVDLAGRTASGMAFTLYGGRVTWDHAGKVPSGLRSYNMIDTDGDGLPDYIEDRNGNGSVDSGETNWNSATDLGLNVFITQPQPGSLLP